VRTFAAPARLFPIAATFALTALSPVALARGTSTQPPNPTEPIVVRVDDRGFSWGDAGIGAAAGFGVALVLAGCLALTGMRDRRVDHPSSERSREPLRTQERTTIEDRRDSP
jgi:hypothetical protein